jgi:hypothetical protein
VSGTQFGGAQAERRLVMKQTAQPVQFDIRGLIGKGKPNLNKLITGAQIGGTVLAGIRAK